MSAKVGLPTGFSPASYPSQTDFETSQVNNTSWKDVGATGGKKLDQVRNTLNEKYVDSNGKTPEDHFRVNTPCPWADNVTTQLIRATHDRNSTELLPTSSDTLSIMPGPGCPLRNRRLRKLKEQLRRKTSPSSKRMPNPRVLNSRRML